MTAAQRRAARAKAAGTSKVRHMPEPPAWRFLVMDTTRTSPPVGFDRYRDAREAAAAMTDTTGRHWVVGEVRIVGGTCCRACGGFGEVGGRGWTVGA